MTPKPDFTMRQLLEEIADIDQDLELGERLTTREIREVLGYRSMSTIRRKIRPLVESGVLIAVKVQRPNMSGGKSSVPAYVVNPNAEWSSAIEALKESY